MNENQKGTALTGGAASDEAIASSKSLLDKNQYGVGQKGLQQFYTPPKAAALVKSVFGERVAVLDPTAGDGSLLADFDPPFSYGIEIDKDQIEAATGSYHAIHGDFQQTWQLLNLGMESWNAIAANPPFGLMWQDPLVRGGKPTNSAEFTFEILNRLLSDDGQYVFIDGAKHFYDKIATRPDANTGIYAVIECADMFEGTSVPCVMAFGIHPALRSLDNGGSGYDRREVPRDMLDLCSEWVKEQRQIALGRYGRVASHTYDSYSMPDKFKSINTEYRRRVEGKGAKNRAYDAQLIGGKLIQWLPSGFATLALHKAGDKYAFEGLNKSAISYFAQNERLWRKMLNFEELGVITIDPKLHAVVGDIIGEIQKEIVPLYAVKPQQRLGFLTDVEFIKCIKDWDEHHFKAGESYRLTTKTEQFETIKEKLVESKKNPGEWALKKFRVRQKGMKITIANYSFTDSGKDASDNIANLLEHFDLPDPGEVGGKYPNEITRLEGVMRNVMEDTFLPNSQKWELANPSAYPYTVRDFQVKDMARLIFKRRGILSWEQGLGKMLGGIAFGEAAVKEGAQDARLYIVPGDLVPQWQREIKRFLGREATVIRSHGHAHQIAADLKAGGTGIFIAHYELLSQVGTRGKNGTQLLPTVPVYEKVEHKQRKWTGRSGYFWGEYEEYETTDYKGEPMIRKRFKTDADGEAIGCHPVDGYYAKEDREGNPIPEGTKIQYGHIPTMHDKVTKVITSREVCPSCRADLRNGWNGIYCEAEDDKGAKCGYTHYAARIKPIASLLSTAFKKGIVVMDEITLIQGDTANRSKALRGLQANYRLGMTGTPIKNYIRQAFWPLWWSLGNGSKRFGYTYDGGYTKFENDFSVIEWEDNRGKRENRKALPEVTNLSVFWRMLASSTIRRRKEETGEILMPRFQYEIRTPLGITQRAQMDKWLKDFPKLFEEKYPDSKVVKAGMHTIMAPMLGLQQKLDYACTIPLADPDHEWTGIEVSNFTPNTLRTLELAMALVKQGRKVLIGSNLVATSQFIADTLAEKGVKAAHILDEDGKTAEKKKRAQRIYSFATDDVQVLCAGVKAIRFGHNLEAADSVILHGIDWDYETLNQFINRVHRLTSRKPIHVYCVLPEANEKTPTFTMKKWDIITQKEGSIELALDGRLIEKHETQIDKAQIVREMMELGVRATGDEIDEDEVTEAWASIAPLSAYEAPADLIPPPPYEVTAEGIEAAQAIGTMLVTYGTMFPTLVPTAENKIEAVIQYDEPIGPKWQPTDEEAEESRNHPPIYEPESDIPLPSNTPVEDELQELAAELGVELEEEESLDAELEPDEDPDGLIEAPEPVAQAIADPTLAGLMAQMQTMLEMQQKLMEENAELRSRLEGRVA